MWRSGRRKAMPAVASVSERHITGITTKYDYRDAEERVEPLREWIAGEPDADQYELPDVAGCIPPCMKLVPIEEHELARIKDKIRDPLARKLVEATLSLERTSGQAERPEISEDVSQLLCDCNPPLPSLLALFAESDAVAACFVRLSREFGNLRWVCCGWRGCG